MQVKIEFSEYKPWAGAVDTYEKIVEAGKLDELESLLEESFCDEIPSETQVNDLLWFDADWVFEMLGMSEEEKPDLPAEVVACEREGN